jgi:hypothetical protein
MMNRGVALVLAIVGIMSWFWPQWNGTLFPPSDVSAGEGHIIGAIFIVGAAVVWFIRAAPNSR